MAYFVHTITLNCKYVLYHTVTYYYYPICVLKRGVSSRDSLMNTFNICDIEFKYNIISKYSLTFVIVFS